MDYDVMLLESSLPYPKTLDKTVLVARRQEIQKVFLLEDAVLESVIDAASDCMEVAETGTLLGCFKYNGASRAGGMEAAPFNLSHSTELDATKHGGGAKAQSAEEQGPDTLTKPDGKGRITEQQYEGSDSGFPLKFPAGGTDEEAHAKGSWGEKKRKRRSKNWSDEDTEILLQAIPQKNKIKSRFDKGCNSEPWWEAVAKQVPGRTGDECRMRMDTLTKSYKAIKEYCDNHKKEFSVLKEEDFGDKKLAKRKLAARFTESWYNRIRDHCLLRSNKKTRNRGAGSSLANGAPVLRASTSAHGSPNPVATSLSIGTSGERDPLPAESHNSDAVSKKAVVTTPDQVIRSKPLLEVLVEETRKSWVFPVDIQVWTLFVTFSDGRLRKCREF